MDLLSWQRTVFGFHGCDRRVADAVLAGKAKLSASANDSDWLRRDHDCFVLNSAIPGIEAHTGRLYHTVRGVFQEGEPAFRGAGIKLKSHIQIAVRDPRAIIGYFRPEPQPDPLP